MGGMHPPHRTNFFKIFSNLFKIFFQFFQNMHINIRKIINFWSSFFPIFSSQPPLQKIPGSTPEENDEDDEEKIQKRYSNVSHESYPNNCVSWSVKNLNIAIALVSWLRLHFLSNMISQTLNNEVLAETVPLKNLFVRTVSAKKEINKGSDFNYSHRLLHTHACFLKICTLIALVI